MRRKSFCEEWMFGEKGASPMPVSLPHDAMQAQGRSADALSGSGGAFFKGGVYEYRKVFRAPEEWKEQEIFLELEGVYPCAAVYLNGKRIGGCKYGYSLFRLPLKDLFYGEYNELCVEVDHSRLPDSRWYSGAGIYRPVWLLTGNKEHIAPDGVRITTLSHSPAKIRVETEHTGGKDCQMLVEIFYKEEKVAQGMGESVELEIPDAHLWSDGSPELYQCAVSLKRGKRTLDVHRESFGIRTLSWSKDGLFVNGRAVLLKGGCIHHDNGILGARSFEKSEWRRIRRLKDNGFNAVRSAHNPACRAMLEACDALGVYVMDEAWDMWNKPKNPEDYAKDFMDGYEYDLESMVHKDQNHPSVILYSIGNEVTEPGTKEGMELAETLIKKLHALDATRPVTAGINLTLLLLAGMEHNPLEDGANAAPVTEQMNSTAYNKMVSEMGKSMVMAAASGAADKAASPILDMLDIAGYNYAASRYEMEGQLHPERIVVGSETYAYELSENWRMVEKYPYLIGDFMWTAWDYLGEAGIGSWTYGADQMGFAKSYPWLLADTGAFDILGNDNAEAGLAAVVWGSRETPYIGVRPVNHPGIVPNRAIWRGSNAIPCWSWKDCEGNEADVEIYSTGQEVELFVNGVSFGRKKTENCRADFTVVYEPGELRAVAYDEDGVALSESRLASADGRTQIRIVPEEETVKSGDILYLDILLTGENGEVEGNCDTRLSVVVEGGKLLAFGSANPRTEEDFLSGEYTTYYGRSQAVVQAKEGPLIVRVTGKGLLPASREIPVIM